MINAILNDLTDLAIITLDTEPKNKAMHIPVGRFVRLTDVITVLNKHSKLAPIAPKAKGKNT